MKTGQHREMTSPHCPRDHAVGRKHQAQQEVSTGAGGLQQVGVLLPLESFPVSPLLMAHLFFFFFFFLGRKVMHYRRQRKAAKQVMQNLGEGTTPKGEGQVRMAHLVCLCPPWQPTNFILMDFAAPSPDARTICKLVCALLPAITFPSFLHFPCVLLGQPLHSLQCGRPVLPAYERAILP